MNPHSGRRNRSDGEPSRPRLLHRTAGLPAKTSRQLPDLVAQALGRHYDCVIETSTFPAPPQYVRPQGDRVGQPASAVPLENEQADPRSANDTFHFHDKKISHA